MLTYFMILKSALEVNLRQSDMTCGNKHDRRASTMQTAPFLCGMKVKSPCERYIFSGLLEAVYNWTSDIVL